MSKTLPPDDPDIDVEALRALRRDSRRFGAAGEWWAYALAAIGAFLLLSPVAVDLAARWTGGPRGHFQTSIFSDTPVFIATPRPWMDAWLFGLNVLLEPALLCILMVAALWGGLGVSPRRLATPFRRFDWGRFLLAIGVIAGWLALLWTGYALTGVASLRPNLSEPAVAMAAALLPAVAAQTLAEEIAFRGGVLRAATLTTRDPILAAALSAVPFAAMHLIRPDVWENPGTLALLFIFGFFWAALTLRSRGLEYAFGLHFIMNYASFAVLAPAGAGGRVVEYTLHGPAAIQLWAVFGVGLAAVLLARRETKRSSP